MSGSDRQKAKRDRRRTLIIGIIGVTLAAIGLIYVATNGGCV